MQHAIRGEISLTLSQQHQLMLQKHALRPHELPVLCNSAAAWPQCLIQVHRVSSFVTVSAVLVMLTQILSACAESTFPPTPGALHRQAQREDAPGGSPHLQLPSLLQKAMVCGLPRSGIIRAGQAPAQRRCCLLGYAFQSDVPQCIFSPRLEGYTWSRVSQILCPLRTQHHCTSSMVPCPSCLLSLS